MVTSIGLKSTTMRAFSGEVLVVCNKEMAGGRYVLVLPPSLPPSFSLSSLPPFPPQDEQGVSSSSLLFSLPSSLRVSRFPRVCDRQKTFILPLDSAVTTKQLEKVCVNITRFLEKLPFQSATQEEEEEDEGGREGGGLKVGFVGAVDLTGWCVHVEVNYTLVSATLTELKQTHAQVLVGVMNAVSAAGVVLVAPPLL